MNRHGLLAFLLLLAILPATGCLPTASPKAPAPPAAAPAPTPAAPVAPPVAAPGTSQLSMNVNPGEANPHANTGSIVVERAPDGGFLVTGGRVLNATIKRTGDKWTFNGTLTFSGKGYKLETPFATPLDTMRGNQLEAGKGMTSVAIPFRYPPKGTPVQPGESESVPVQFTFDAPEKTQFIVALMPVQ